MHPEKVCQKCGKENPSWYAPNTLWNRVTGNPAGLIICPDCFQQMAIALRIPIILRVERLGNADHFHRWVLRLATQCLEKIALSGLHGTTRQTLGEELQRHERSIRRGVNFLRRKNFVAVKRMEEYPKYGGRLQEILVATKDGVVWLNQEKEK